MAVLSFVVDDFALATLPTGADEAGGPPPTKIYELRDNLVIDDDLALLKSLEQAARLSGIRLVTASTWEEGLETFQVLSPSVVIADFNMPGSRHGLQLLWKIRQLRPSVRLILVSAYLDERDVDAVMALGVVDRALTKGTASETAEAVLDEAKAAVELERTPTDWVAYAQAFLDAGEISGEAFDKLDEILVRKVEEA